MGKYVVMDLAEGKQVVIEGSSRRDAMKTFLYRYDEREIQNLKDPDNIDLARYAVINARDIQLYGHRSVTTKLI